MASEERTSHFNSTTRARHRALALVAVQLLAAALAHAGPQRHPELWCHRTANQDVPENTLESLNQAALLGCNVVEVDVRRTLDGQLVLNHDGFLERLTDGVGEVETSLYGDLASRDAGSWMGQQFAGMRVARFSDALRLARDKDIRLILDIKTKGIGSDLLRALEREGMLHRVRFGGESEDVRALYPQGFASEAVWVQPGVNADEVTRSHLLGKFVVANFSANEHAMDLLAMKSAIDAGVDAINVDYPRFGAEAVGRSVEQRLQSLIQTADNGPTPARLRAVLELAQYYGFPGLQHNFAHWLTNTDPSVSRAAAFALATTRPRTLLSTVAPALHSPLPHVRANAVWAMGLLHAPASTFTPLLQDGSPAVLQSALMALAKAPGTVDPALLVLLLDHKDPAVRGAAAVALASHDPQLAATKVPERLRHEVQSEGLVYNDYLRRGKPKLTAAEIAQITDSYRCQMKMMQAIAMIHSPESTRALEEQAFRGSEDFSRVNALVAGFNLWDRSDIDIASVVQQLGSANPAVADNAEWILIHAGPQILPALREALRSSASQTLRLRAIHVLAFQNDRAALADIEADATRHSGDSATVQWAAAKLR